MWPFAKKKMTKYDCIWREPDDGAPWEWQTCNNPKYFKEIGYSSENIQYGDVSCCGIEKCKVAEFKQEKDNGT